MSKKPCHAGAAYICNGWTNHKDPVRRKRQKYCFKCGRPIAMSKRHRWAHLKESEIETGE